MIFSGTGGTTTADGVSSSRMIPPFCWAETESHDTASEASAVKNVIYIAFFMS